MNMEAFQLRTLTPLWTGGVNRNSGQAKEAGLLGSLRWWYEGLIRGLVGYACDPTAHQERRCELSGKEKRDEERRSKLCAACYLFGCTGWARRFRLEAEGFELLPLFFTSYRSVYLSNGNWLIRLYPGGRSEKGRSPMFHFDGAHTLWADRFSLRIMPMHGDSQAIRDQLVFLSHLISTWGALGAKTQNGFGQVQILNPVPEDSIARGRELIKENARRFRRDGIANGPGYFRLDRFFSTTYEIRDPAPYSGMEFIGQPPEGFDFRAHFVPCAFDIRYKSRTYNPRTGQGQNFGMRPFFRDRYGQEVTNALLGETRPQTDDDRTASRIGVSHLFRESPEGPFRLKIWSWVPDNLRVSGRELTVGDIVQAIDEFITGTNGMFPGSRIVRRFDWQEIMGNAPDI